MGSSGSGCFPEGLRVLVVDDDHTSLKILEKMLKKCNYEVTTSNLALAALDILETKKGFDIVISDVNMGDMDGFEFLEHVGLKMDLPVIMMSGDGDTSRVMKGVQHGACDYLLKPIRLKELRNIWQHVYRKRMQKNSTDQIQTITNGSEQSDDAHSLCSVKKRKEFDSMSSDRDYSSSVKKARVVWTVDLHQKFVKAVNRIGSNKVGPKKILDLMGVPWLTRENVASHLQKYRLYLSRLQKENELKAASGGLNIQDISQKDPSGNIFFQSAVNNSSVNMQQNIVINGSNNICEGEMNGILSMPTDSRISSNTSRISFNQSFELQNSQVKSESKMQAHYTWGGGHPSLQFNNGNYAVGAENTLPVQPHLANFTNCHLFDHPLSCSTWSATNGNGSAVRLHEAEFNAYSSSPVDFYLPDHQLVNLESFGYCNQELIGDVHSPSENFDSEYPSEDLVISNQDMFYS